MNKYIQDAVEDLCMEVAMEAYVKGLNRARDIYNNTEIEDDQYDKLREIVKNKMEGK